MHDSFVRRSLDSIAFSSWIRASLVAGSLASAIACSSGSSGGGGSGSNVAGWTAMPLVDDTSDPANIVAHKDNDLVTGIYYASADKGFIVTQGANATFGNGGAVFKATGSAITSVAFSGDGTGISLNGTIDFVGIEPTPTGYIATAYASDIIQSTDGGLTFGIAVNGSAGAFGIEPVLAYRVASTGTTLVRETGVVTVSNDAPGPTATYEDIWAPNAIPSIPDPVPVAMCQNGPLGTGVPVTHDSVYASADRMVIAYTASGDTAPEICISTDAGESFYPHVLDVPSTAADATPTGVMFTSPLIGITWFAQSSAGAYIKRTVDGGTIWTDVALPAGVVAGSFELPAGFFAPDGVHGWLAGYDDSAHLALVLATSDGGVTWAKVSGVSDAVTAAGGDKLYSGFALDATHVWLGGANGLVIHN